MDAVTKLWIAHTRGKRTDAVAQAMVNQVAERLADPAAPLYTSDEHGAYLKALEVVAETVDSTVLYGTVNKTRQKGRIVEIKTAVALGTEAAVATRVAMSVVSCHINTSFIERLNLSVRQENRRCQRKTLGFSKEGAMLDAQLALYQAYYNLVRPHRALRQPAPASGRRRWSNRTPAMEAGAAQAVWSLDEMLAYWPVRRAS